MDVLSLNRIAAADCWVKRTHWRSKLPLSLAVSINKHNESLTKLSCLPCTTHSTSVVHTQWVTLHINCETRGIKEHLTGETLMNCQLVAASQTSESSVCVFHSERARERERIQTGSWRNKKWRDDLPAVCHLWCTLPCVLCVLYLFYEKLQRPWSPPAKEKRKHLIF